MVANEKGAVRHQLLKLGRQLRDEVDTLAGETFHQADGKAMGNLSNISVDDRAELGSENCCEEITNDKGD